MTETSNVDDQLSSQMQKLEVNGQDTGQDCLAWGDERAPDG